MDHTVIALEGVLRHKRTISETFLYETLSVSAVGFCVF